MVRFGPLHGSSQIQKVMTLRMPLEEYVKRYLSVSSVEAMNRLQDRGIVSDNCVNIEDVAKEDQLKAMQWLSYPGQPHQV